MNSDRYEKWKKKLSESIENGDFERWLEEYKIKQEQELTDQEQSYKGDLRELHWLMTAWINKCKEYGSQDTHIFAVELVNTILDRGFDIIKADSVSF